MNKRVLVTGGSVAANTLAWWLVEGGFDVTVVEKAPEFRDGGQSVDVRGAARTVIGRMGLSEEVDRSGTGETAWTYVDEQGEVVARFKLDDIGPEGPTAELEILRGDLAHLVYVRVLERVDYRFGDAIAAIEDGEDAAHVRFESGAQEDYHLVLVAEGVGSSTRELVFPSENHLAKFNTLQAYYSIAGRDLERELGPMLEAEKMGLLVWSPLAGGLLSGKFSRDDQSPEGSRRSGFDFPVVDKERAWNVIDVLRPIAEAHGCSPARIALAWLLAKPVVTSVLVGAKRLSQLEDNIAAVDVEIADDELARLDAVSELPPEYPGWMLATQGADRLGPVDLWRDKAAPAS